MWWRLIAATFMALVSVNAVAEETIKVGLILPLTGLFTTTQVEASYAGDWNAYVERLIGTLRRRVLRSRPDL
jgi:hypothetical protein